jgi:hypothetical protein
MTGRVGTDAAGNAEYFHLLNAGTIIVKINFIVISFPQQMKRFTAIALLWLPVAAFSQQEESFGREGTFTFETDTPYKLLELDQNLEPIVTKKKKPKRKTYYGIKTKKGFTRKGFGDRMVIETFYYLKKNDAPTKFVRDIYWYDFTRREIRKTGFDPKKGVLVHGPYKRICDTGGRNFLQGHQARTLDEIRSPGSAGRQRKILQRLAEGIDRHVL